MTSSVSGFVEGAVSLLAGLGVTIKAFFQPVVTSQYPRRLLKVSPRFRGHIKLLPDAENPDKSGCIACGICMRNCPSGSIKSVEGEKREGEKRKTVTSYTLDYTTCSQCGICVESCPYDCLGFSADFNAAGFRREDFHYDLVREFEKRKATS